MQHDNKRPSVTGYLIAAIVVAAVLGLAYLLSAGSDF